MSATFEDVKRVLNFCLGENPNWHRIALRHRNSFSGPTDPHLFGWETEEQLLHAKARGHWLINPECRGNGKGAETNLVRILTQPDGLFGYPRMPLVGNKIDLDSEHCRTLIDWINSLPQVEEPVIGDGKRSHCDADARFLALGDELPPVPTIPPGLNFVQAKRVGSILYLSGMGPQWGSEFKPGVLGKVWQELSIKQGYDAARLTGLNLLHVVRENIGSLNSVKEVLEVFGMVNGAPTFNRNAEVLNGCSDLLVEIFGDRGKHIRTAAGGPNPFDIVVYIKMSVIINDAEY